MHIWRQGTFGNPPSLLGVYTDTDSYVQRRNIKSLEETPDIYSCEFQYITKEEYEFLATQLEQITFSATEMYRQGYAAAQLDAKNRADLEYLSLMTNVDLDT